MGHCAHCTLSCIRKKQIKLVSNKRFYELIMPVTDNKHNLAHSCCVNILSCVKRSSCVSGAWVERVREKKKKNKNKNDCKLIRVIL